MADAPKSSGYRPLDEAGIRHFLNALPDMRARLGGDSGGWAIREVGDGNLNLVFLVNGPDGGVCVKQSLPYVRAAGESWPMPLERTYFEQAYYKLVGPHVKGLAPEIHHYDPVQFALVMEQLSPHIIMRRGLIGGRRYPDAARHVGDYIARASFFTSDLAIPLEQKFAGVADFANNLALRRITAELVFTDPYRIMERNRWTSPELDDVAASIRADGPLKIAAARRGQQFLASSQALIHGDLHTGSVMVTETDTRVIDPEFAVYGPIGFDLGAFLANLLMSYYSQPGHASVEDDRRGLQAWLLEQVPIFWQSFAERFRQLWRDNAGGDAYPKDLFGERCRPGRPGRRTGSLPRRIVRRHDRLCRRQDHPPHFRLRAQCRFRTDRRPHGAGQSRDRGGAAGAAVPARAAALPHAERYRDRS